MPDHHEDEQRAGALTPYRILDLTTERSWLTGRLLADLGATVTKIEPPGGDRGRLRGPYADDVANAENNNGADADELKVKAIMVDEGPSLKRFMARAKGRGTRITKRTSHITVVVGEGK